jgi:lipid-binding SYLF domain-containing protein
MNMPRTLILILLPLMMLGCSSTQPRDMEKQRTLINQSAVSVGRLTQDSQFPELRDYIRRSKAVLIIPNMYRAGFVVGGEFGNGLLMVRTGAGNYTAAPSGDVMTEELGTGGGQPETRTSKPINNVEIGSWGNPVFYRLAGGSFGLQIGGQAAEIIITVMTDKGLNLSLIHI